MEEEFGELTSSSAEQFWRNVPMDHGSCGLAFVVDRRTDKTRDALQMALSGLCDLEHRTGKAFGSGDGAGVMVETHSLQPLLQSWLPEGIETRATLSAGMLFFQGMSAEEIGQKQNRINHILGSRGILVHGWRKVPMVDEALPNHVTRKRPEVYEILYSPKPGLPKDLYREMLFHSQNQIERELGALNGNPEAVAVVSLNPDTLVYKARATGPQLGRFYPDLADPLLTPRQVATHARMGTNTEVTWPNVQPAGVLMHNGEINADRAVRGAERDRQIRLAITARGEHAVSVGPWKSDSRAMDAIFQRYLALGVRAPKALRRLILPSLDDARRYPPKVQELHALIERTHGPLSAVQGPAAIVAMTGHTVTMAMDPAGLRTLVVAGNEQFVVGGSEMGSPRLKPEEVQWVYALEGGDIAVVKEGEFIPPDKIEVEMARKAFLRLEGDRQRKVFALPAWEKGHEDQVESPALNEAQVIELWNRVGGEPHVLEVVHSMLREGKEPIVGMGDDRPLAVLSPAMPRIAEYFKQVVAVVTNPPLDPLREGEAMDTTTYLGRAPKQVSAEDPKTFRAYPEFKMESPILTPDQWKIIQEHKDGEMPEHVVMDTSVGANSGEGLKEHLESIITRVVAIAEVGKPPIVILSDREMRTGNRFFVPPVFVISALEEALKSRGIRDNVKLVVDTADALEAHDMALLISQGADAVHPYLLWEMAQQGVGGGKALNAVPKATQVQNLKSALDTMLKTIMSKMGILSINGYRGACLFEAIGIGKDLMQYLPNNTSQIGGITWQDVFNDQRKRVHDGGGKLRRIKEGGAHGPAVWKTMHRLSLLREEGQSAEEIYDELLHIVDTRDPIYLRDLLGFVPASERDAEKLSLEEVEPADQIIRNCFRGSAMSDGALGPIGHAAIAAAFNTLGSRSNCGEGGENSARYPGGPLEEACSKTKQIASGRFGVNAYYIISVGEDGEIDIKIGQGAKPAEGGHLRRGKVSKRIGRQRGTRAGIDLISPPPHHDIYSIEDLMRLIWDIRAVHPEVHCVSVKITTKAGTGTIVLGIAKCGADKVVLSGSNGGTAAAKSSAIHHTGGPLELSLLESHRMLERAGMRDKIKIEADGGILTGRDIVKLAILGAEEFGFGTALLMAGQGCIFCNQCSTNQCPTGITTTLEENLARLALGPKAETILKSGSPLTFEDQYEKIKHATIHYLQVVAEEVREILASLGVRSLAEARGRVDLLKRVSRSTESDRVDLDFIWDDQTSPEAIPDFGEQPIAPRDRINAINQQILDHATTGIERAGEEPVVITLDLSTEPGAHALGATLAGRIASGKIVPPPGGFHIKFKGYSGQSLGFCMVDGMRIEGEGFGRDFVGSGMGGGKIILRLPQHLANIDVTVPIAGNTTGYGATAGKLFMNGRTGQRTGVRMSKDAILVCEGTGKYPFQYMTGGIGVVLGEVGLQVGSGMSDGTLYLWGEPAEIEPKLHGASVKMDTMTPADEAALKALLEEYTGDTQSPRAASILADWDNQKNRFVKVISRLEPQAPTMSEVGAERFGKMGGETHPLFTDV